MIGNQFYEPSVGVLKNPHNDIALVSQALGSQGYQVLPLVKDATRVQILGAVRDFVCRLDAAGPGAIGLLYYSGHGAAEAETKLNYLIPIDAKRPGTEAFWDESVKLDDVLRLLNTASAAAKFVVFDACRNELRLPYRGAKGFEPVREQPGIYVAYTTAPGQPASDDGETSGPYAAALAAEFAKPGLDHLSLFQNVKEAVYAATKGAQAPWESNGLIRRVYLTGQPKPAPAPQKPVVSEDACDGLLVSVAMSNEKPCIMPGSGKSFRDCPDCPEMVVAPAGSFTMGSPTDEPERESWQVGTESPQHEVRIAKPFAVGRFHITRGEWLRFVKATGHKTDGGCWTWAGSAWKENKSASWRSPGFDQDDSHPAVCVNWNDAKAYAAWLSKQTGKTYRLLSEAEAEYVARAGTTTPFWWGSSITPEQANYDGSVDPYKGGGEKGEYRKKTLPVKSFEPNPWGLYQVHGNAWSWVEDCWHDNYSGAPVDGSAWTTGDCGRRVLRGGSWYNYPRNLRAAYRYRNNPDYRNNNNGFRLARTLNP